MQRNNLNQMPWKTAFLWVVGLEVLAWTLFTLFILTIRSLSTEDFLFRYPKILAFNMLVLPLYFLLFRQRINLAKITHAIPKRLLDSFLSFRANPLFWRKWILFRFAIFFFLIALSQPLFGSKKGVSLEKNSEVVIAMDISNSMNTKDIDPDLSRLDIAKRAAIQLINGLKGERLGVLVFAGNAYVQLPITKDYNTAKLFIHEIDTRMLTNQGTNFAAAIELTRSMFSEGQAGKCMLLITDGENHETIPEKALSDLPEENIFLAVVGLGTKNGGQVPRDPNRSILGYLNDENGRPVVSKVGGELVRKIAKQARGIAMVTENPFPNLSNLLTEINQLNKGDLRNLELDIKQAHFQWPLLCGLMLWLVSLFTSQSIREKTQDKND